MAYKYPSVEIYNKCFWHKAQRNLLQTSIRERSRRFLLYLEIPEWLICEISKRESNIPASAAGRVRDEEECRLLCQWCSKRPIGTQRGVRRPKQWDAAAAHSWECLLPAKQCKRDQNSLAVCSSFIKRRHFACITSAAPRTLFSEAALASGIRLCKSILLCARSAHQHQLYRNSRVCEHTSFSHVSVCVSAVCVYICGYDVSFWAHYSHNAGAREAVAACMRVLCVYVCVGLLVPGSAAAHI
jgi:hypothetical protein